jgi:hypothetical protein
MYFLVDIEKLVGVFSRYIYVSLGVILHFDLHLRLRTVPFSLQRGLLRLEKDRSPSPSLCNVASHIRADLSKQL